MSLVVWQSMAHCFYSQPIPLELLIVTVIEENGTTSRIGSGRARNLVTRHSSNGRPSGSTLPTPAQQNNKNGYAMVFTHLGRKGYDITLWTSTWVSRKNWLEKIEAKQLELRERSLVFDSTVLSEGMFSGSNRVTCAAPYDAGQRLVFGTDSGVWLADLNNPRKLPVRVINVANVTQVEVLDDHGLLIVLAGRSNLALVLLKSGSAHAKSFYRQSRPDLLRRQSQPSRR